ncbi:ubiquitin-associated protein 2a isoform X2 [Triplophysa rosa]|uniref:ubiquitin-associated protein 2a isoform X2 n=1 Tax=Triplophysa rosa TaxID=992332 RepID=UPI0025460756|nr:ubiquitin-associated protein 2a isoform X2 [Triplophysa rosa]
MMTSVGVERTRGTRDKALPTTTQTTQPQKQLQATAEQIRLAQMIYDKNDADFEDKVKQLMEVTGKNQDDCMVALHDCNEDVNRAINFLLEGTSDTTSWETVGKKKSLGKDGSSTESKENKENREKKGERESSKGRGGAGRRGRGTSRNRPARTEENGVEPAPVERGADRGRRGRGRVSGGRGRGRAPVTSRFTAQGMGTFNPADYTTDSGTSNSHADVWETGANDTADGTVAWQNTLDEWAAEDWSEDLSETKVFTSSCAPPTENHITPGQSLDLSVLLQKPVDREEVGGLKAVGSSQGLGHSLVFTNSHHQPARDGGTSAGSNSYTHATLSSVLGSGFGELGVPKLGQTAGQQILEQLKGPGLGQLTSQPSSIGTNCTPVGGLVGTGISVPSSSWDIKPPGTQSSASLPSQFSREFQMQPEPSLVLSQLAQRQQGSLTHTRPLARQPSPPPLSTPSPAPGTLEAFPKAPEASQHRDGPSMPPSQAADSQGSSTHQRQIKTQKRRIPPTSKIPSSAVEMPGSTDVSGLNVQFGALDFGSESALPDFGQSENCNSEPIRDSAVVSQSQSCLYSKPVSEALTSPVPMLLPLVSSDSIYPSPSVPLPSLAPSHTAAGSVTAPSSSSSSSSSSAASSAGNSFDCGVAPHSRLTFSQSKEPSGPVTNGFNGVRTSAALDTTSSSSTPKQESHSLVSSSTSVSPSAPSSLLPPSVTPHSSALPSLASELSPASLPPLSSHVSSGHSSVSALCTPSSLTYTNVDSVNSLAPSSMPFSSPPVSALTGGSMSSLASGGNSLHASGVLGHGTNGIMPSGVRTAPLLSSSSSKAPPNLSQGVPPLLPNQYIMGPGGLLPAYPQIYGYEDLHMLQSRLPVDYYGITFPGPTATLSGRDGNLASNPYSGDVTKFGRGESTSPAPSTSLSAAHAPQTVQPPQAQSQGQSQPQPQGHHNTQQTFLNPALPPGYSYTGLPYYPGMPGVPSAFQYGPAMFVPPASAKQHGMGLSNPTTPFQQPSGYGQHAFSSGYDDLTQGPAGTEYSKVYSNSQTQAKSAGSGPGKGVSVTSSNSGVPDISGTVYNKTQTFDKQGFHAGTPPPFNLPSALGGTGPLTPGAAPGYAPAPFLHILPAHQQPHSQLLHHHLTQDGQGGPNQRSQSGTMQQKTQVNKSNYGSSPYWGN